MHAHLDLVTFFWKIGGNFTYFNERGAPQRKEVQNFKKKCGMYMYMQEKRSNTYINMS